MFLRHGLRQGFDTVAPCRDGSEEIPSHCQMQSSQVFADKIYSFVVEHSHKSYQHTAPGNFWQQAGNYYYCVFELLFVPKCTSSDKHKTGDANQTEIPPTLSRIHTFWAISFVWGSLWDTCKGKETWVAWKNRRQHQPVFAKSQIWLSSSTSKHISITELPLAVQSSLW